MCALQRVWGAHTQQKCLRKAVDAFADRGVGNHDGKHKRADARQQRLCVFARVVRGMNQGIRDAGADSEKGGRGPPIDEVPGIVGERDDQRGGNGQQALPPVPRRRVNPRSSEAAQYRATLAAQQAVARRRIEGLLGAEARAQIAAAKFCGRSRTASPGWNDARIGGEDRAGAGVTLPVAR